MLLGTCSDRWTKIAENQHVAGRMPSEWCELNADEASPNQPSSSLLLVYFFQKNQSKQLKIFIASFDFMPMIHWSVVHTSLGRGSDTHYGKRRLSDGRNSAEQAAITVMPFICLFLGLN